MCVHADAEAQDDAPHTVSYLGALHQALSDLADWVEHCIASPASSAYEVIDGQVAVPSVAIERTGVQPVVTLSADGGARADVTVGEPFTFVGHRSDGARLRLDFAVSPSLRGSAPRSRAHRSRCRGFRLLEQR